MPRVIVTTDAHRPDPATSVLLDEQVASIHLHDGHSAAQLIERLAWAIVDAEERERATIISESTLSLPRGRVPRSDTQAIAA